MQRLRCMAPPWAELAALLFRIRLWPSGRRAGGSFSEFVPFQYLDLLQASRLGGSITVVFDRCQVSRGGA